MSASTSASPGAADRPNILLLFSDEHSFRFMGHRDPAGDGEPVETPAFDALARRGTVFDQTYCQVPLSTPSRICMLTGRDPMGSGGWGNEWVVRPGVATLPAMLADAGYATCLNGKMHLGGRRQMIGFQHRPYGDMTGGTGHQWEPLERRGGMHMRDRFTDAGRSEIPEPMLQERLAAEASVAWIREQRHTAPDQPWFLCASFSRPHFPLNAPQRWIDRYPPDRIPRPKVERSGDTADHPMTLGAIKGFELDGLDDDLAMRARAAYFACVSQLDEIVGDMLAMLERSGLLENTVIVYTSDHGELAGEHGLWWKNTWHEAAARVPLIVQTPEQRRGERPAATVRTPVSLADLMPTFASLAGVEPPADLDGVSLAGTLQTGEEPTHRGPVVFDNPRPRWGDGTEHRVMRDGPWKYVRFRGVPDLLFNLDDDPLEQRNLIAVPEQAAIAKRLRDAIDASWDFDAADQQAEEDQKLKSSHALKSGGDADNLWMRPDGSLVDADAPLYAPRIVTTTDEAGLE